MKRLLVWLTLIAMLLTLAPAAGAQGTYTYAKGDVMTAVSGMGRMPSNYYNLAGIALESIGNVNAAQAENFTKKMYTVWAFLSKYAYAYNGNKSIKDSLTPAQWTAVINYASKLAYDYGTPPLYQLLSTFMSSAKAMSLVKPGVPRSLLGIRFDEATAGTPATVKVYTTTDVTAGVYLTDVNGAQISDRPKPATYPGTLASFNEFILTVDYPSAGKNGVRVYGVDAAYPENFFTAKAAVSSPADSGTTTSSSAASVTKVTATAVPLGAASTITVTTSQAATSVKITDKKGVLLAVSKAPVSLTATPRTFVLTYCFPSSGVQQIRAYAGTSSGGTTLWNKNYKTAKVSVASAASKATISKATASPSPRGQAAEVKVYASSRVTRVQLFDVNGNIADFTRSYTTSGKLRVFKLHCTKAVAGAYKLSVQAGNDIDWNPAKKAVVVKFLAPSITKVTATKARRGTASTITVRASAAVTSVELYDAAKNPIATQTTRDLKGNFVFTWSQPSKGTKTIYLKGYDSIGGTAFFKGRVTFT